MGLLPLKLNGAAAPRAHRRKLANGATHKIETLADIKLSLSSSLVQRAGIYAEARFTTVEQLVSCHLSFLVATEQGLVVDSGRGLDSELLGWATDYAKRRSTTVPQLLLDYLERLRREDQARDLPSI